MAQLLNRHNLNIAALCSKEDNRFTLQALLVEPDKTVETDGHQLVMVTRPPNMKAEDFPQVPGAPALANGDMKPFLMPADSAKNIMKALPKKVTIPILSCAAIGEEQPQTRDGSRIIPIITTDLDSAQTHTVRALSGNFPDYARVMPKPENQCYEIQLDAVKLKALLEQFISFNKNGKGESWVEFRFYKHTESAPSREGESVRRYANPFTMDADGGDEQHMTALLYPGRYIPKSLAQPSAAPSSAE